jgi:hypothetical protein
MGSLRVAASFLGNSRPCDGLAEGLRFSLSRFAAHYGAVQAGEVKREAGISPLTCRSAPGRTRTCDPLLRRYSGRNGVLTCADAGREGADAIQLVGRVSCFTGLPEDPILCTVLSLGRREISVADEGKESLQVPVVWTDVDETPILFANQFVSQFQPGEFVLTFGQVSPPVLLGSEEERREQALRLRWIPIKAIARVGLTRARMEELIGVLRDNLENHDRATGQESGHGDD